MVIGISVIDHSLLNTARPNIFGIITKNFFIEYRKNRNIRNAKIITFAVIWTTHLVCSNNAIDKSIIGTMWIEEKQTFSNYG